MDKNRVSNFDSLVDALHKEIKMFGEYTTYEIVITKVTKCVVEDHGKFINLPDPLDEKKQVIGLTPSKPIIGRQEEIIYSQKTSNLNLSQVISAINSTYLNT